jgi:hypothetical protein
MKRSEIRGCIPARETPDCAALHPGYACCSFDVGDEPRVAHIKYANQNGDITEQEHRQRSLAFAAVS